MPKHMKLKDRLVAGLSVITRGVLPASFISALSGPMTGQGVFRDKSIEEMVNSFTGYMYGMGNLVGNRMASSTLRLYYRRNPRGSDKVEEITEHVFLDVWNNVNDYNTKSELMYLTGAFGFMTGEMFFYTPLNRLMLPAEIWPLFPQHTAPVPGKDGIMVASYKWRSPSIGKEITFDREEVIPIRVPSLKNYYRGYGKADAAVFPIDIKKVMDRFEYFFNKNLTKPGTIIESEDPYPGEEDEERMLSNWNAAHNSDSMENIGGTTILWNKMKIKQAPTPKEMSFLQGRKYLREEMAAVGGIQLSLLGAVDKITRSNLETADFLVAENVIGPFLRFFSDHLNKDWIRKYDKTGRLFVEFDDPRPTFAEDERKDLELASREKAISPDELREELTGKGPSGFGGRPWVPSNMLPAQDNPAPGEGARPKPPTAPKPPKPPGAPKHGFPKRKRNPEADGVGRKGEEKLPDPERDRKLRLQWESFVARVLPIEALMVERVRKIFDEQEKGVLKRLNKVPKAMKISLADIDAIIFAQGDAIVEMTDTLQPMIENALNEGALNLIGTYGLEISFDLVDPVVIDWIKNRSLTNAQGITTLTLKKLRRTLATGIQLGESIPKLANRIRKDVYNPARKNRAVMIARTETAEAANKGALETMRQAGVKTKEWLLEYDDRTCEYCAEFLDPAAGITPIDEPFHSATLGDVDGPPLHPNCRCTVAIPIDEA